MKEEPVTSNGVTIVAPAQYAQINKLIHGKTQPLQNLDTVHSLSVRIHLLPNIQSICTTVVMYSIEPFQSLMSKSTFETSNSITGIFREVGSIRWRKNLVDPNVSESMSSEATA